MCCQSRLWYRTRLSIAKVLYVPKGFFFFRSQPKIIFLFWWIICNNYVGVTDVHSTGRIFSILFLITLAPPPPALCQHHFEALIKFSDTFVSCVVSKLTVLQENKAGAKPVDPKSVESMGINNRREIENKKKKIQISLPWLRCRSTCSPQSVYFWPVGFRCLVCNSSPITAAHFPLLVINASVFSRGGKVNQMA